MQFFRLLRSCGACLPIVAASVAGAQNNNCLPPTGKASAVSSFEKLHGSFLLLVYATTGPKAGRLAGGTLDLAPAGAARRAGGTFYVGTTSVDLRRVGARFTGSLLSRDPAAPGVTFEVGGSGQTSGTLVFGSVRGNGGEGSKAVAVTRADVSELSKRGWKGFWRSTAPEGSTASGYYCATRY